ncbi:MAG: ECF transporter S component [Acutalibacteraceae bacterium]|nr:ECF transporter S component [Acutalibacteraceae bacterium]
MSQKYNTKSNLIKMVLSGLMAALICVSTSVFVVPLITGGYANLGDCFVIIAGYMLGPIFGGLASGIGSCLADIFLGYTLYAPFTFIIKASMAIIVYYMSRIVKNSNFGVRLSFMVVVSFASECFMVLGYFLLEVFLYGYSGAIVNVFGNSMQGLFACISAVIVYSVFDKNKIFTFTNKIISNNKTIDNR